MGLINSANSVFRWYGTRGEAITAGCNSCTFSAPQSPSIHYIMIFITSKGPRSYNAYHSQEKIDGLLPILDT